MCMNNWELGLQGIVQNAFAFELGHSQKESNTSICVEVNMAQKSMLINCEKPVLPRP